MQTARSPWFFAPLAALALVFSSETHAGAPFVTDDPEPVGLHHWEFYIAAQQSRSGGDWSGPAPIMEANYGALPDLQLHLLLPFISDIPSKGKSHYGLGDAEFGFKYRFVHETENCPEIAIYPAIEIPTGDEDKNLGGGETQVFLPIWLQKDFGEWTTYGGGGYWINPGKDNRDYWYAGWEIQHKITESLTGGFEVQFRSADTVDTSSSFALNAGGIWDISDTYHILFSAGHSISGPSEFQAYLGLQITLGPEERKPAPTK